MEQAPANKEPKKLIEEFLVEEEKETIKNIDVSENLISDTKRVVDILINGQYDYDYLSDFIIQLNSNLTKECDELEKSIMAQREIEKKVGNKIDEEMKKKERKADTYLALFEKQNQQEEKRDLEINLTEKNYKEIAAIIQKNLNKKDMCLRQLNQFYQKIIELKNNVATLKEQKEAEIHKYNSLLRDNLDFKASNAQYEIKKIHDFLEEISAEDKIQAGKFEKQKIKELENRYYEAVAEYNKLAEKIINIVRSLEGLNIDNPRLSKELEIINKELYPFEKRLNRSFTQMYENHEWDDVDNYIKENDQKKRANYKKFLKSARGKKTYFIAPK